MSADIIRLPFPPRLRLVETTPTESVDFRDREVSAAEMYLDNVTYGIARARRYGLDAEGEVLQAAHAAEGVLFHLLTAAGALTADRELRNLLQARLGSREAENHG